MRHPFSLLLCFFVCFSAPAQQFAVNLSEAVKELPRNTTTFPLAEGGFIGITKNTDKDYIGRYGQRIRLAQYDKNMNLKKQADLSEKNVVGFYLMSEFKKIGDRYWLIYVEVIDKNSPGGVKAVEINPQTLEPASPKVLVSKEEANRVWTDNPRKPSFIVKSSPDGLRTGLYLSTSKNKYFAASFDDALKMTWSSEGTFVDKREDAEVSIATDNAGTLYAGYANEEKGYVNIYVKDREPVMLPVNLGQVKPSYVVLLAHKHSNTVSVTGMYKEEEKNLQGVYKATINTGTFQMDEAKKTRFPLEIVQLFDKDGFGSTKPGKYGLEPGHLLQLEELGDGSLDMVAEVKYFNNGPNVSALISGPILNVWFGPEKPSFARLPKNSVAGGAYWKHFRAFPFGEKMIIFYNDKPDNLGRDINETAKDVDVERNSVLVAGVIERDGSVKRLLPIESKEKYMGIAEWIQIVSSSEVQLLLHQGKRKAYARIAVQ